MAKQVANNVVVKIGGVDLSQYVGSVSLSTSVNEITTTNFSSNGTVERVGGLKDNSLTISFMQDFAAAALEATIYPLIGSTAAFVVNPSSTAPSATAPNYTGTVVVLEWTPVAGAVGELLTADVTWPITGAIAKATA
jgi:hypothetical protein